jgi:hypothetical protein
MLVIRADEDCALSVSAGSVLSSRINRVRINTHFVLVGHPRHVCSHLLPLYRNEPGTGGDGQSPRRVPLVQL